MSNEGQDIQLRCFISYSWDSEELKTWVRNLATRLQSNAIFVHLDQWDTHPGIDLTQYMETCVRESDHVLVVCTPRYAAKANSGKGGVGYEKAIITGEIFGKTADDGKFVPLVREGEPKEALPSYLASRYFLDFRSEPNFEREFEMLLRHLYRSPQHTRPSLGIAPSLVSESSPPAADIAGSNADLSYVPQARPRKEEQRLRAAGARVTCPHCESTFYAEEPGWVDCPDCSDGMTLDDDLRLKGRKINCPHCESAFYTEETGWVECRDCSDGMTLDKDFRPVGGKIECPHCGTNFYTEETGWVECPDCSDGISLDKDFRLVGGKIECPHCGTTFYASEIGRVECPDCGEGFTVRAT